MYDVPPVLAILTDETGAQDGGGSDGSRDGDCDVVVLAIADAAEVLADEDAFPKGGDDGDGDDAPDGVAEAETVCEETTNTDALALCVGDTDGSRLKPAVADAVLDRDCDGDGSGDADGDSDFVAIVDGDADNDLEGDEKDDAVADAVAGT